MFVLESFLTLSQVSLYNFILLQTSWQTIILRALDLITIIIPPALPAAMAIGTSFALNRLQKSRIHCTRYIAMYSSKYIAHLVSIFVVKSTSCVWTRLVS